MRAPRLVRDGDASVQMADASLPPFAELYRAHVAQVARWLRRLGVPPSDVEDAVHDVFVVAFRRLGAYEPERASFSTWVYGIAMRIASARRRRAAWQRLAATALTAFGVRSRAYDDGGADPSAPADLERRE